LRRENHQHFKGECFSVSVVSETDLIIEQSVDQTLVQGEFPWRNSFRARGIGPKGDSIRNDKKMPLLR
jgi:hypothetical protein